MSACGWAPLQATGNPPGSDRPASQGSNPFLFHYDQVETWVATVPARLMRLGTVGRPGPVVGSRLHQRSTTVYTGHTVKQLVGRGHEDGPQARNTFKAVIRKGRYNVRLSKCNQRIPQTILN